MSTHSNYEKSDVATKKLFIVAGLSVIAIAAIIIILSSYFMYSKEKQVYESVLRPVSTELRELRANEQKVLTSYDVINEAEGTYQIPIEQAMKLLAEEAFKKGKK